MTEIVALRACNCAEITLRNGIKVSAPVVFGGHHLDFPYFFVANGRPQTRTVSGSYFLNSRRKSPLDVVKFVVLAVNV